MSQVLAPMLGAMVICRSIACFVGYPFDRDRKFTNVDLLLTFSGTLDSCAQSNTLWNFSPVDVATIFSPLIDYAELAGKSVKEPQEMAEGCLGGLEAVDIETMQTLLNFADAIFVVTEIDNLARVENSWSKWFGFIRYTKTLQMEGLPKYIKGLLPADTAWDPSIGNWEIPYLMRRAMSEEIATENFFDSCLHMRSYIIGYNAFKESFLSFAGRVKGAPRKAVTELKFPPGLVRETSYKPTDKTEAESAPKGGGGQVQLDQISNPTSVDSTDPFLSPSWTIASELRGRSVQLSPMMALLMDGTTVEPRNTNWYNKGRFEWTLMK